MPVCEPETKEIRAAIYRAGDKLTKSAFGVPEPLESEPADISKIDLCLVPGLVFDLTGTRIGFGAGYYDRFLPRLREDVPRVGLAFDFQLVSDILPSESHDYKLTHLCTEKRLRPTKG